MTENAVLVYTKKILGQIFLEIDLRESLPWDFSSSRKKMTFWTLFWFQPSVLLKKIYLFYLYP